MNPSNTFADCSSQTASAILAQALENNKSWADKTCAANPSFFTESSKSQAPKILWLGCGDSRVSESLILGLEPGQIFTHRNIANIISSNDLSSQSIIEFAVGTVGVEQVIVCGHTQCGGVLGVLGNASIGAIDVWLRPLRQIRQRLVKEGKFEGKTDEEKAMMIIEENVRSGVEVVRQHPSVLKAAKSRSVKVHGMIYELHTGLLRQLDCEDSEEEAGLRAHAHDLSPDASFRH